VELHLEISLWDQQIIIRSFHVFFLVRPPSHKFVYHLIWRRVSLLQV